MKVLRCSLLFLAMTVAFSSCRIFEDRDDCPCWLMFLFEGDGEISEDIHVHAFSLSGSQEFSTVLSPDMTDDGCELEVSRGLYHCSLFSGIDECVLEGMKFLVPEGRQTDRLFLHISDVDCIGESAEDEVVLKKEWTTVRLSFDDKTKSGEAAVPDGLSVVISTDVCGIDLLTGDPVYGPYRYVPEIKEDAFSFRLLRHPDSTEELVADFYLDGQQIDSFHLGEFLSQSGFDWDDEHLSDVFLSFDLQRCEAFIKVVPWNGSDQEHVIF